MTTPSRIIERNQPVTRLASGLPKGEGDGPSVLAPLTFAELSAKSQSRRDRWHTPDTEPWTGADWSNAMCGEAGEAANVVKKLRRHETGMPDKVPVDELLQMLADELGDVVAYCDLLGRHYGIDLGAAVARKFNQVSEREGFPERIAVSQPPPRRVVPCAKGLHPIVACGACTAAAAPSGCVDEHCDLGYQHEGDHWDAMAGRAWPNLLDPTSGSEL